MNKIKHLPTGLTFSNRKEAKSVLGHSRFNRALKDGMIAFVATVPSSSK